jgi:signal transduction histidine kinase
MIAQTNILLIDDSEDDRLLFRRCLKKSTATDYAVTEAATGEDGLIEIDREPFACVLLDYSLPGHNGVEVLKRIRAKHPFVPVVMLTGLGNEKIAVAAMREGAQDYLAKSTVTPELLEHLIDGAIQHCEMQSRIAEQRETLEIFSRAMAHDLREPLRTMRSMLDVIEDEVTFPDETQSYFRSVRNCAVRMTSLIDSVRFYTRLDGNERIIRDECDTNQVIDDAIDNIRQLIIDRQAVITRKDLPRISADRTQAIQAFQNLLCNAIQHCSIAPQISVSAVGSADHWQFHVSDNGPGISEDEREKLFKPFSRFSRSDTQGTGMGLAICKKLMDMHGGRIWCEPPNEKGATFVLSFPKKFVTEAVSGVSDVIAAKASAQSRSGRQLTPAITAP